MEMKEKAVVVIRESKDWIVLNELEEVVAVVSYEGPADEEEESYGLPVFHPDEYSGDAIESVPANS